MAGSIDPVEFGKLITCVETLSREVHQLSARLDALDTKVDELSALRHKGVGIIFGLMMSGGALGATVAELWSRLK